MVKTFTADLKIKKIKVKASLLTLKAKKRLDIGRDRKVGGKGYELAEDVESLENRVELLKFKKEKQREEIEKLENVCTRIRYECTLLTENIRELT